MTKELNFIKKQNGMMDCIHLRACRRLCKLFNIKNRGCNIDCSAYKYGAEEEHYTYDDLVAVKNGACRDGQRGYEPGDLLAEDYI